MKERNTYSKNIVFVSVLYITFLGWWIYLHFFEQYENKNLLRIWSSLYPIITLYGGLMGLWIAKQWGGIKSVVGRAIGSFSIGLFLQLFGQISYSYYIYALNKDIIFPSVADIGFFGSIIFYIYGVLMLAKASNINFLAISFKKKTMLVVVPLVLILLSYNLFLKNYNFVNENLLNVFLNFGYPIFQIVYISLAVVTFSLSQYALGGKMRRPILIFIFALLLQYISDFAYLYQVTNSSWSAGNLDDLLYCSSYFIMSLGLIYIGNTLDKIKLNIYG